MDALIGWTVVLNEMSIGFLAAVPRVAFRILSNVFAGIQVLFAAGILLIDIIITVSPSVGSIGPYPKIFRSMTAWLGTVYLA